MKKVPTVFLVNYAQGTAVAQVRPGSEWVARGEGTATVKFDGSACLWRDGRLWKRYDRKLDKPAQREIDRDRGRDLGPLHEGLFKTPPEGFEPCEAEPDPVTYHWPGWVPVSQDKPEDRWHVEALAQAEEPLQEAATYELVGPALAKNPYGLERHELWRHGRETVALADRSFEGLRAYLQAHEIEGLVFHHADGRMAKVRRKDFGLFWVQDDTRKPHRSGG
ncbi:hypothetical protein J5226_09920 [Lysobacter sp. K5869]|uniref:RNA ligase 1 family protein n=1 Tax=Lysobacter sp. K5869 TaxID=2820808 RepID=UPI001C05FAD3|nr:DUF5565 family protein [Lysobacter sp. K5869]QWP78680.1 hypothetical protein J5226_09920 [Lysobacter sp. K5869]